MMTHSQVAISGEATKGYSTSHTGVRLLPESVGGGLGSFVVGLVTRRTGKYSALKIILPILILLETGCFAFITIDASSVLTGFYLLFQWARVGGTAGRAIACSAQCGAT